MRLGLTSTRRRVSGPRVGLASRRPGRPAYPAGPRSTGPRPLRRSGLSALLAGLAGLAAVAVLLALLGDGPDAPPEPRLPSATAPVVRPPNPTLPPVDGPSAGPLTPPQGTVDLPEVGLPDGGGGSGSGNSGAPADQGPEKRTEMLHVHHRLWLWDLDWILVALALTGIALAAFIVGAYRRAGRTAATIAAASLIALATLCFVLGIHQDPGPGTYQRNPPEVERTSELIFKKVEVDHYHAPTHLNLAWLLAGLGLAVLAIAPARAAVAPPRQRQPAAVPE